MRILLSRTDSIGDVVLSLPMAGLIKNHFPEAKIYFLGRNYTKPIIKTSDFIEDFINLNELEKLPEKEAIERLKSFNFDIAVHVFPNKFVASICKKANIKRRIGVKGRWWHWVYCNERISLSRKNSNFHESQLNLKLLQTILNKVDYGFAEIADFYQFNKTIGLANKFANLLDKNRYNLILHPKSKGSAKEWGLDNFSSLIKILPKDKFKIFISGTAEEGNLIGDKIPFEQENVHSLIGQMTLDEFISFIREADGLVAASTGPLHIAAALGIQAIGIFSPKRPIHPGRWMPVGKKASHIVFDENCDNCEKGIDCNCIMNIKAESIRDLLKK